VQGFHRGHFTAANARQLDGQGQFALLAPQVKVVHAARTHAHHYLVSGGRGVGDFAEPELAGLAVGEKLDGFHSEGIEARSPQVIQAGKARVTWSRGRFVKQRPSIAAGPCVIQLGSSG